MKIRSENPLLFWSLVGLFAYWAIGAVIPGVYISGTASLMLLVAGSLTFLRYASYVYSILFHRIRDPDSDGSHLAAYGVMLFAAGSIYTGVYGLLWIAFGAPIEWTNTVYSAFGRYIMAAGFMLMFFSPDVDKQGLRLPGKAWIIMAGTVVLLGVFFFGVRVGFYQAELGDPILEVLPKIIQHQGR